MSKIYGLNQNINFETKESYIKYLEEHHKIDVKNIYYVDKEYYDKFIKKVIENKKDYFYGIFLNDSIMLNNSKTLSEKSSCGARIILEINNIPRYFDQSNSHIEDTFKSIPFYRLSDNKKLQLNKTNSKNVIMLFSYKMGQLREKDMENIEKAISKEYNIVLYIISLDRIKNLNY